MTSPEFKRFERLFTSIYLSITSQLSMRILRFDTINYHKLDGLEQLKFFFQLWVLEFWNQRDSRVGSFCGHWGSLSPDFWRQSAVLGAPWWAVASLFSSHGSLLACLPTIVPLCMSVFKFPSYKDISSVGLGAHPTPIWAHLKLTTHIYNNSFPKSHF